MKALVAYSTKNPVPPEQAPSLREAIRMVAKIGGFWGVSPMRTRHRDFGVAYNTWIS
ncbi:MAG: hypothetical protein IPI02_06500 [Sterolibacteriaceae bacterium]|nr:hypothetical protein [Sterolibacteriaceae bacterium]